MNKNIIERYEDEVKVTLEDDFVVRFWVIGLTDEEYIKRSKAIRAQQHLNKVTE